MGIIDFTMPQVGSFLVEIIIWLVKISSSIALGIVLFTVILKLITLPFDYVSRASMRKNSLKMEEMRPELEKLQKQYADNKDLYNQKMMALYKKNGYSMFGACLPTILTLVIFIVAINAFTDYSRYQNKMDFYHMSQSYNSVLYAGFDIDESENAYLTLNGEGYLVVDNDKLYESLGENDSVTVKGQSGENQFDIFVSKTLTSENHEDSSKNVYALNVYTQNGYVLYKRSFTLDDENKPKWQTAEFLLSVNAVDNLSGTEELDYSNFKGVKNKYNNNLLNSSGQNFKQAYELEKTRINGLNETITQENEGKSLYEIPSEEQFASTFIGDIQSYMAALRYREEQVSFIWVKNIWVTDSPMKSPVEKNWSSFKSTHAYDDNDITDAGYNKLIAHLGKETTEANGYFILVALTALTSLLTQIVMGKSQKASMELQTVDGQGAQTQKVMKWMMPIMMAFFAFMYTAAFSIYIVLSSLISLLTTFGINFIVDRKFKKQNSNGDSDKIRGRVYVAKEEEKKEEPKKKTKDSTPDNDFLSGKADNKKSHIRGRVK